VVADGNAISCAWVSHSATARLCVAERSRLHLAGEFRRLLGGRLARLHLYLNGLQLFLPALLLLKIAERFAGPRIVQEIHLPPEEYQCAQALRVAEGPGLQVHPRLLPHRLPV